MDSNCNALDYDILGYKVKLQPNAEGAVSPDEVVEHVRTEALSLREKMPSLAAGEAILLVALRLTQEKMELEREYRKEIDQFRANADDVLKYIDEVSPTA
jgi:hypothetical protein